VRTNMIIKLADKAPSEKETNFETALASLAYNYIKDKCPRIINFLVGFQLIQKNEDNTKAIGIFGAKAGDSWYYIPIIFDHGSLHGHELLYSKNDDVMLPLNEKWVNFLTSTKDYKLGLPTEKKVQEIGALTPNLFRIQYPPLGVHKIGSDQNWLNEFLPFLGCVATSNYKKLFAKHANLREKLDLRKFLTNIERAKFAFEKLYLQYPGIKKGFDQFYGEDFFENLGKQIKTSQETIIPVRKKPVKKVVIEDGKLPLQGPNGVGYLYFRSVSVSTRLDDGEKDIFTSNFLPIEMDLQGNISYRELNDREKEQLLRDSYLVRDRRHPEEVSELYDINVNKKFTNPSETGVYDILVKNGQFKKLLVIVHPHGKNGQLPIVVLYDPETQFVRIAKKNDVWAKACHCPIREELREFLEDYPDFSEYGKFEQNKNYILIGPFGNATLPFEVIDNDGDNVYTIFLKSNKEYLCHTELTPTNSGFFSFSHHKLKSYLPFRIKDKDYYNLIPLIITKQKGTKIYSDNDSLFVPETFKVLEVKTFCDLGYMGPEEKNELINSITPAALIDIELNIKKALDELSVRYQGGSQYIIKSKREEEGKTFDKIGALIHLMTQYHLSKEDAQGVLKEAEHKGTTLNKEAKYYVKYPEKLIKKGENPLQPGPSSPSPSTLVSEYGTIDIAGGRKSLNAIPSQELSLPIDDLSSRNTDISIFDPFALPDPYAVQLAQEAARNGQKEIFDTAIISGMLKAVHHDDLLEKYITDILLAIDKIGRILFMLYWHRDRFAERYGKHDLPELESGLKNAFETLGDLYLFLKEKSTGGLSLNLTNLYAPRNVGPSLDEIGESPV